MIQSKTSYISLPAIATRLQSYSALIDTGYKFEKAPDQLFLRELIKYTNSNNCDPSVAMFVQKIVEKIINLDDAQWLGHIINIGLNPNMTLINAHKELKGPTNILGLAAVENAINCAQELVNRKANMNDYEKYQQANPLLYAVANSQKDMTRILIQSSIEKNVLNSQGDNILHIALELKSPDKEAIFKAIIKNIKPKENAFLLEHLGSKSHDIFSLCLMSKRADAAELVLGKITVFTQATKILERARALRPLWKSEEINDLAILDSLDKVLSKLEQKTHILSEKQKLQNEVSQPCVRAEPQKFSLGAAV